MRRKIAAGNWKMHGLKSTLRELEALKSSSSDADCDIILCPPATLMAAMAELSTGSGIIIGGQDCHWQETGAHTGDISAEMLADAGAGAVILGHSERRADHRETDASVHQKTLAAWRAGLHAIVCIGETEAQRDAGETLAVIGAQMQGSTPDAATTQNTIIAYEPVWAIGTGRTPTLTEVGEVHDFLRANLVKRFGDDIGNGIRLLYGGSVNPANARDIFAISNVDGGLVGGASLKAADFAQIIAAAS
ncbi:MAG: triose-phosphate isomerase [Paracoccaceae bacterium]